MQIDNGKTNRRGRDGILLYNMWIYILDSKLTVSFTYIILVLPLIHIPLYHNLYGLIGASL